MAWSNQGPMNETANCLQKGHQRNWRMRLLSIYTVFRPAIPVPLPFEEAHVPRNTTFPGHHRPV